MGPADFDGRFVQLPMRSLNGFEQLRLLTACLDHGLGLVAVKPFAEAAFVVIGFHLKPGYIIADKKLVDLAQPVEMVDLFGQEKGLVCIVFQQLL